MKQQRANRRYRTAYAGRCGAEKNNSPCGRGGWACLGRSEELSGGGVGGRGLRTNSSKPRRGRELSAVETGTLVRKKNIERGVMGKRPFIVTSGEGGSRRKIVCATAIQSWKTSSRGSGRHGNALKYFSPHSFGQGGGVATQEVS